MTEQEVMLFADDPEWAKFLPEVMSGGPKCGMPDHDDCSPIDADDAAMHLTKGGTLGNMPGYESRNGQLDMLRAVMRAFNTRSHLMIEAGTGVGKSLAYLIPSVLWSFINDTPVVISTATRNLQSQLLRTDLPRAISILGAEAGKFRAAVLKGRGNYLCLAALAEFMQGGWYAIAPDERETLKKVVEWLHATEDGDLDTLDLGVMRNRFVCTPDDCAGRACPWYGRCFVARARAKALKAHVVVANHSLVLAEASTPGSGLLPPYGRLIVDEAHNLPDIATEFFSTEFSRQAIMQTLGRLSRMTRNRRGQRKKGLVGAVTRQLAKGALRGAENAGEISVLCNRAEVAGQMALTAGDDLLAVTTRLFNPMQDESCLRYQVIKGVRQYSGHGLFADYDAAQWNEPEMEDALVRFEEAFARVQMEVAKLGDALSRASEEFGLPLFDDLVMQARTLAGSFNEFIADVKFTLSGCSDEHVFWIEKVEVHADSKARGWKQWTPRLVAAPLSVAKEMKHCFYDVKDSVVLCSATLRVGDKFDYCAHKFGFDLLEQNRTKTLVASSPFDYFRQTKLLSADFLPDPSSNPQECVTALQAFLPRLITTMKGRTLVLFTSYEMMKSVAENAQDALAQAGIRLLVQGDGITRDSMTTALRTAEDDSPVALFGAQSFWEGVDVPGEALSCVVMVRLPFPQVGEPIVEARAQKIDEAGGSSFRAYMLPEAIIRYRQGFGRLIRSKSDRGVVVVTDPRMVVKNYGGMFRKAVATSMHRCVNQDDMISSILEFMES